MTTGVKNFIEENIELIENEDWETIENKARLQSSANGYSKGEFHETLIKAGINPLPFISYVPYEFLKDAYLEGSFIVPGNCRHIEGRAFYNCQLSKIILEEGVEKISPLAFAGSNKLESVIFPSSLISIESLLFTRCNNLKEIHYNGTYDQFKLLFEDKIPVNNFNWFGSIAGLASTNCILKCKDQDISLRMDI